MWPHEQAVKRLKPRGRVGKRREEVLGRVIRLARPTTRSRGPRSRGSPDTQTRTQANNFGADLHLLSCR